MPVIKANDSSRMPRSASYNFDDMARQGEAYLDQVKAESAKIVTAAQREAEELRKQAAAQGRKEGQEAIEQLVRNQVESQMETLLPALREAVSAIGEEKQAWQLRWEKRAIGLALAVAERIVRRELAHRPEISLEFVKEALELASGNTHLRIHLNPADHASLGTQVETLVKQLAPLTTAEFVPSGEISPGGCRLETQYGVIDQQLEAQLARIEAELT